MSTTRPELRGTSGTVASTRPPDRGVGRSVPERGGGAVDAAVAAACVLRVVEPRGDDVQRAGGRVPGRVSATGLGPVSGALRDAADVPGTQGCAVGR